jgi:STE24 endopeptidase
MHAFTLMFLCAVGLSLILQLWLAQRHINHVQRHRAQVPPVFNGHIPLEAHQRAADYTAAKTRFGMVEAGMAAIFLLLWTLGGGLNLIDQEWRSLDMGPLATGVAVFLSVLFISAIIELPATVYRTFVLESRFGFNRTTVGTFVADLVKNTVLLLIIGAPVIFVVLWLMESRGNYWWLYVWAFWTIFGLFITWAYPTLIAPLFNRFSPLQDDALRSRIQALLARCGFQSDPRTAMPISLVSGAINESYSSIP